MSQLGALIWLKWRLFRNSMRSRKAVAGRLAGALATLAALAFSLSVAAGLGAVAYFLSAPTPQEGDDIEKYVGSSFVLFLFMMTFVYMMWAVVPLGLEGGSRFEPRRMLLYPISLGKLFAVDLLSELTNLSSVFAVPVVVAVCLGAGLGRGAVALALGLSALALAFGVALSKLCSTLVGALMSGRRTRGEALLAIMGAVLGLSGVLLGQLIEHYLPRAAQYEGTLRALRWTPPGSLALGLTDGLTPDGAASYAAAIATLAAYAAAAVALTYMIARRTALGVGGAKKSAGARAAATKTANAYGGGWQLPWASAELSAVVEKELRYALRNAQLRGLALMAVALTVVMRLASGRGSMGRVWPGAGDYTEGMQMSYGVLYVFLMVSALTTNLFGYEGAGMRSYVLAPVERRVILLGKNLALTVVVFTLGAAAVVANALVFQDLTWRALLATALTSVTFASLFALGGNWLSINFPKRTDIGRRMNRSGVAGLLILPLTAVLAAPPALAALAGWGARSVALRYVILALFALASLALYSVALRRQARAYSEREVEIMEAVAGRDDDTGQVMS